MSDCACVFNILCGLGYRTSMVRSGINLEIIVGNRSVLVLRFAGAGLQNWTRAGQRVSRE